LNDFLPVLANWERVWRSDTRIGVSPPTHLTMRYQISHITTYTYSPAVTLEPHIIRLRPRSDSGQTLHNFRLDVSPEPIGQSQGIDLDGNNMIKVWFDTQLTQRLQIQTRSQVETHFQNPFNYLLEPWALKLPIDYPSSVQGQLQPYLGSHWSSAGIDPVAIQLAQEICHQVAGETGSFLIALNQRIYENCQYVVRETGEPFPPSITWQQKSGSCRDVAVLFMEVCRAVGLATRFVSGYQEGDPGGIDLHLHAWVEVYLPGAGWRGYDPTHGLAVADRHIALAASALPQNVAPLKGGFLPITRAVAGSSATRSQLTYTLSIQPEIQDSVSTSSTTPSR